jgi:hypothetical protein
MGTADALEALAVDLRAAGLNAYLDPAEVSPPGVVIRADAEQPTSAKLCGGYPVRVTLWAVAPDTNPLAAYRAIDDVRDRTLAALPGTGATPTTDDRTYERLVMPGDPTGLPALRIPVRLTVPAPATERAAS